MSSQLQKSLLKFSIPKAVDDISGELFDEYFEKYLKDFLDEMNTIPKPVVYPDGGDTGLATEFILTDLKGICVELKSVLELYLKGLPALAFNHFEALVKNYSLDKDILRLRILKVPKHTPFFRTQGYYQSTPLPTGPDAFAWDPATDPKTIFHPPFNKRKRVGTNRFSIPGYPCLYLSDKLITSYKEATQHQTAPVYAISLYNNRPLYIADISPIALSVLNDKTHVSDIQYTNDLLTYLRIFPLVAASHLKINYSEEYKNEVKFKVEYIIPQLLLQWFQKNSNLTIDGLKYQSCSAALDPACCTVDQHNFILTTEQKKPSLYCPKLSHLFNISPVLFVNPPDASSVDTIIQKAHEELLKVPASAITL